MPLERSGKGSPSEFALLCCFINHSGIAVYFIGVNLGLLKNKTIVIPINIANREIKTTESSKSNNAVGRVPMNIL
jgi:hypothetical protein